MKKHSPNPNNAQEKNNDEVSEAEVQSQISNADRLDMIAEQLGFDALKNSSPAAFVKDWLNQFSGILGFGSGNNNLRQRGSNGNDNISAVGGSGKDKIKQIGRKGNDNLDAIGGKGLDRIIQRGGRGRDVLNAMGNQGNDKIKQRGGRGRDELKAIGGQGRDRIVQKGGRGKDTIVAKGGGGNDKINQKGGRCRDKINAKGGKGRDKIKQKGGRGRDHLFADGGKGNDKINQKGGRGNDTLEYSVSEGKDVVTMNGGRGKDTGIIHTNGHAVVVQDKKGKVLFASGGKNKNYTGGGTTIKVKSIENLDIRTPENKVVIPEVDEPKRVNRGHVDPAHVPADPNPAPEPVVVDVNNQNGVTDVATETQNPDKGNQGEGPKVPDVQNTAGVEVGTPTDGHTDSPSTSTPTLDTQTPTTTTPTTTAPPTQVTNPSVPAPSGSNTGPEICSVYTRSTQVLFSEEAVDVYFNARDAEWDDLTWDYKWSGGTEGSVSNEGPTTWIKTSFNLPALNVIAGDSITVEATVRDPSGLSDTESITIDVIGEEIAVWEVFFDSESLHEPGGPPTRIDPLIFDLNKDGQLDITGANQEGDGKIDGEGVLFDMDPRKQGTTGWKWSSPGHRPGYYHGGENSRVPKVPNGTAVYDSGKVESTDKAGVGRWFEDRSKGNKADIFDKDGNLVGMWDKSTWGESHQGRIGQYYWEPSGSGEKRERTEWIKGTGDGFLVWDHNNNGIIDDNTEMMSEFDQSGQKMFNNGFEKLAHYFDKDKDGVIKGTELNGLKFWVDDGDAITEDGELQSLDSYGITEIVIPGGGEMTSTSTIGKMPG